MTLQRDDAVLGSAGTVRATEALATSVARNAWSAAFGDPRPAPFTADDLARSTITVSVVSPMVAVRARSWRDVCRVVRVGDGLLVETPTARATLLPSAWNRVDGAAQFVDLLWHKAGLHPRDWPPNTSVRRYTTDDVSDPGPRTPA